VTVVLLIFLVVSVAWAIREILWTRRRLREIKALMEEIEERWP
jgi:hypothetical protein